MGSLHEVDLPHALAHARVRAMTCSGIVPVCTQEPPTWRSRSITATRLPAFAAWIAAFWPAGPEPMTTTSKTAGGHHAHVKLSAVA